MREDPRFCISNEFLIDVEAARSGTTHPEVKKEFKKRKKEKNGPCYHGADNLNRETGNK